MILRRHRTYRKYETDRFRLDRLTEISKPQNIQPWTAFDFTGRGTKHSAMKWNKDHFNGVDWDQKSHSKAIWKIAGKEWARDVDDGNGNYDFLCVTIARKYHPGIVLTC